MERVWTEVPYPAARLSSLLKSLGEAHRITVLIRDPDEPDDIVVVGQLTHDMALYPFLDVRRQIRRYGVDKRLADHYADVLRRGGVVVSIESAPSA